MLLLYSFTLLSFKSPEIVETLKLHNKSALSALDSGEQAG